MGAQPANWKAVQGDLANHDSFNRIIDRSGWQLNCHGKHASFGIPSRSLSRKEGDTMTACNTNLATKGKQSFLKARLSPSLAHPTY
jgi:hypothetical protein